MRKEFTIAAIAFLLAAAPAFAQSSHANNNNNRGNSEEAHTNHDNGSVKGIQTQNTPFSRKSELDNDTVTVTPTTVPSLSPSISPAVSPSITPCNPDDNWKNHGKYVSCVAKLHKEGKETEEAAHSNIGKFHYKFPTPSVSPVPSTSPIPSVSPSASPEPSVSPAPSVSPTPITTAMGELNEGKSPLNNIGAIFQRFFKFFEHWI